MANMPPVAVLGAGAIGGFLAGRLAAAGHPVAVAARGAHGAALAARGLVLHDRAAGPSPTRVVHVLTPDEAPRGAPALTIVAGKAHQLGTLCRQHLPTLLASEAVLFIQNGFPWWYFVGEDAQPGAQAVSRLDPDGWLRDTLSDRPLFASLAFKAAEVTAPGVVWHYVTATDRFPVGPVRGDAARAGSIVDLLRAADIPAEPSPDIRREIWAKLMGNVSVNPLCALARCPVGGLTVRPETMAVVAGLIDETIALAGHFGHDISDQRDWRLQRMRTLGAARPSMLQDIEAHRPMEVDAIVGALSDLARASGVQTPRIDTVHGALCALAAAAEGAGT